MRALNDLSMWKKQLLSFLLIILIPYIVSFSLAQSMGRIAMENAQQQADSTIERMESRIQQLLSVPVSISSGIAYDSHLIELITTDYGDPFAQILASWVSGNLSRYIVDHTYEIDSLFGYSDTYDVLNTGYIKNATSAMRESAWYQYAKANPRASFWAYVENESFARRGKKNLALCRSIDRGTEWLGVLCIFINEKSLHDIVRQEDFDALICDPSGWIVAAQDEALLGKTLSEIHLPDTVNNTEGSVLYHDKPYSLRAKNIDIAETRGGLRLIALYDNKQVLASTHKVTQTAYVTILIGAVVSVLFVFLLSRWLSKRLERVSAHIHHVANGDLDYSPQIDGTDEIGRLSSDLDGMLANLRQLIRENYAIKLEKQQLESYQKDIKLDVLSSQINPHFLFNTLESIRMMSVLGIHEGVASAIQKLSMLMRKSLYAGTTPVPLPEELQLVRDYLALVQMRFRERLSYRITVSDAARSALILPFLLQPLVENAIRHGIEAAEPPEGHVILDVQCEARQLLINVIDNGAGIPAATLQTIQAGLASDDVSAASGHIGLLNVNQRIKLYYGREFGLRVQSAGHGGTIVTVRIPRIEAHPASEE